MASGGESVDYRPHGDVATFMEVLNTSIANAGLPHIAGSLSAVRTRARGCYVLSRSSMPSRCR